MGEAGLKKKTGLGMAALIIGANLPDIDVLGLLVNENLAWRRGWPLPWFYSIMCRVKEASGQQIACPSIAAGFWRWPMSDGFRTLCSII